MGRPLCDMAGVLGAVEAGPAAMVMFGLLKRTGRFEVSKDDVE